MRFETILMPRASREVDAILDWLRKRSLRGAENWNRRFLQVLEHLEEFADGCGLAPEEELHPEPIRHYLFKTRRGKMYRALFVFRGNVAYILSVRGPGQDILQPDEIELPADP